MHTPDVAPRTYRSAQPSVRAATDSNDRSSARRERVVRVASSAIQHVQLLERPAEVAQGVAEAAQRAAQSPPPLVQGLDDVRGSIDDAEVELLAGVDCIAASQRIEDRSPVGADADDDDHEIFA